MKFLDVLKESQKSLTESVFQHQLAVKWANGEMEGFSASALSSAQRAEELAKKKAKRKAKMLGEKEFKVLSAKEFASLDPKEKRRLERDWKLSQKLDESVELDMDEAEGSHTWYVVYFDKISRPMTGILRGIHSDKKKADGQAEMLNKEIKNNAEKVEVIPHSEFKRMQAKGLLTASKEEPESEPVIEASPVDNQISELEKKFDNLEKQKKDIRIRFMNMMDDAKWKIKNKEISQEEYEKMVDKALEVSKEDIPVKEELSKVVKELGDIRKNKGSVSESAEEKSDSFPEIEKFNALDRVLTVAESQNLDKAIMAAIAKMTNGTMIYDEYEKAFESLQKKFDVVAKNYSSKDFDDMWEMYMDMADKNENTAMDSKNVNEEIEPEEIDGEKKKEIIQVMSTAIAVGLAQVENILGENFENASQAEKFYWALTRAMRTGSAAGDLKTSLRRFDRIGGERVLSQFRRDLARV